MGPGPQEAMTELCEDFHGRGEGLVFRHQCLLCRQDSSFFLLFSLPAPHSFFLSLLGKGVAEDTQRGCHCQGSHSR